MFSNFGANKININKTNIDLDLDRFMEIKKKAEEQSENIIDVKPEDLDDPTIDEEQSQ
jgi:hypothetical protein